MGDKVQSCTWDRGQQRSEALKPRRDHHPITPPAPHPRGLHPTATAITCPAERGASGAGIELTAVPHRTWKREQIHPGYFLIARLWHFFTSERSVVQPLRVLCNPCVCAACCTQARGHTLPGARSGCTRIPHKHLPASPGCTGWCLNVCWVIFRTSFLSTPLAEEGK